MSQKKNRGGRPKGLPKTGGRKKGTRNRGNVRLREVFAAEGFDFVSEVMETLEDMRSPEARMKALLKLAPYFMQRLRQEEEAAGGALGELIPDEKEVSNEELLKVVKGIK
jgi:hypothetical protein